jgi:signal transduction histidine kinase
MALSSSSRFTWLAVVGLLVFGGVEFLVCAGYLREQCSRQVTELLGNFSNGRIAGVSALREDLRIIAPGSDVHLLDAQGRPLPDGGSGSLPESQAAWARICTAGKQTPCVQGNAVATAVPTRAAGAAGAAIVVVSIVQRLPTSLLLWISALALLAAAVLGWAFHWTVNHLFQASVVAAFDPGSAPSGSGRTSDTRSSPGLLQPDDKIAGLAEGLKNKIGELDVARLDLVSREKTHLEWIAYLSHDLASPLARMLRRVESIQYDAEMKPDDKETTLEQVHRDITELAEIVGSISQFAILESGIERCFENMPLNLLLESTVDDFEYEASSKGIELDLRVADDVGPVRIERSLIKRAVENLISNAIRYTPEGGLITVSARRSGQTVDIVVEDTGTGVPVQELDRVFNFAFKGEGHTRISKVGSLGLGLALVRKVAEVHSGTVTASNVEPNGARFVVSLPSTN